MSSAGILAFPAAGLVLLALAGVMSASALAQDSARGLRGLPRVALEVSLSPDLVGMEHDLEQRVERALREQPSAPVVNRNSVDKLRLVARVRAESATELRGFWLPFSGTYAIGHVRLEVERPVTVRGPTPAAVAAMPAVVWHAERLIARPWREAGAEIGAAADALVKAFLEDHGRARER